MLQKEDWQLLSRAQGGGGVTVGLRVIRRFASVVKDTIAWERGRRVGGERSGKGQGGECPYLKRITSQGGRICAGCEEKVWPRPAVQHIQQLHCISVRGKNRALGCHRHDAQQDATQRYIGLSWLV